MRLYPIYVNLQHHLRYSCPKQMYFPQYLTISNSHLHDVQALAFFMDSALKIRTATGTQNSCCRIKKVHSWKLGKSQRHLRDFRL